MCPSVGPVPGAVTITQIPTLRGRQYSSSGGYLSAARLAADAIGVFTLTLSNVVIGSRVNITPLAGGAALHDAVAAATTVVVVLSVYSPGSPGNDLRIRVRNASGTPTYKPYETQATAKVGALGVFVSQVQDE